VEFFKGFDFWVVRKIQIIFLVYAYNIAHAFYNGVHHHALYHYTISQKLKVHSI